MCNYCTSLIVYKHSTGTGGMQKHIECCLNKSLSTDERDEKKITSYFNKTKNKSNYVSPQIKDKLAKTLSESIVLDSRPFETINGDGFISLINATLSIGHSLLDTSNVSTSDLLMIHGR